MTKLRAFVSYLDDDKQNEYVFDAKHIDLHLNAVEALCHHLLYQRDIGSCVDVMAGRCEFVIENTASYNVVNIVIRPKRNGLIQAETFARPNNFQITLMIV